MMMIVVNGHQYDDGLGSDYHDINQTLFKFCQIYNMKQFAWKNK